MSPRPIVPAWADSHARRILPGRRAALACLLGAAALLGACTVAPPIRPPDFSPYRDFLIEDGLPALEASGVVSFTYRGVTQSGEVFLRAGPGPATVIQLHARVTGSLALEVRLDDLHLLVLDYVNRAYYQGDNLPGTRQELFGIDLTPGEFRTVVTGRVERRRFEQGRGTLMSAHVASFQIGEDRYVFTLGEDGLPLSWVKQRNHVLQVRVEYRSYVSVPAVSGQPVRMPERVRVYVDEPQPRIVLGLREFAQPAAVPPLTFALPPEAADFKPQ